MEELHEYVSRRIRDAGLEMTPEFYPLREGAKIRLFKARIINPKEKYRKEIRRYLEKGRIDSFDRIYLEIIYKKLQISPEEAQLIEQEEFAPVEKKQENLKKYETALRTALTEGYVLDSEYEDKLELIQQALELLDEEVEPIKQKIIEAQRQKGKETEKQQLIEQADTKHQEKLKGEEAESLQQQKQEHKSTQQKPQSSSGVAGYVERILETMGPGKYGLLPSRSSSPEPVPLRSEKGVDSEDNDDSAEPRLKK